MNQPWITAFDITQGQCKPEIETEIDHDHREWNDESNRKASWYHDYISRFEVHAELSVDTVRIRWLLNERIPLQDASYCGWLSQMFTVYLACEMLGWLSPTIPAPIIVLTAKGKRDEQTTASLGRFFFVMIDE